MLEFTEKFFEKFELLNKKNTFLVGFSGGCDSLCLLDVMVKLSEIYKFRVVAIHLNHNWRGEESADEENRCREFAKGYGIDFISETLPLGEKVSEENARNLRYEFFERCAKKYNNSYILTAHNANDNAETLLYRIAKGTGLSGLCGIPEIITKNEVTFLRPLLYCMREDIEKYCREQNLVPNQDSSNLSLAYKRNYIRHKVLPEFERINKNAVSAINNLCEIARDMESTVNALISDVFEGDKILTAEFNKSELKSFIIHKFLINNNLDYDKKKVDNILEFLKNSKNIRKKFSLTTDVWLSFDEKYIYTIKKQNKNFSEINIEKEGKYFISDTETFEIAKTESVDNFPAETDFEAVVDLSALEYPFVIRTRRDGDVICPFGMSGKMKLKKYLISKKIPQEKRDNLLLLAKGSEIYWVIGVGLSNKLRVAKAPANVLKYNKEV